MERHQNRLCCFWFDFPVDCYWWVLLIRQHRQDLFQSVFMDCNPYHFSSQLCSHIFAISSLPDCGRLSFFLHCIVDSMICFSQSLLFRLARTVWILVSYWYPSNWKLFASISWTRIWILSTYKIYYCLGSCHAPSSCFLALHMRLNFSLISFFCFKHMQLFSQNFFCLKLKNYILGGCADSCCFICNAIYRLCCCITWLILMLLSWSTTMH